MLRGDMTLVGPRPLPRKILDTFDPEFVAAQHRPARAHRAVAGGRPERPRHDRALELDRRYLAERSMAEDLRILARTPAACWPAPGRTEGLPARPSLTTGSSRGAAPRQVLTEIVDCLSPPALYDRRRSRRRAPPRARRARARTSFIQRLPGGTVPLPAPGSADAAGGRAVRPVALRARHLERPRGRQGRHHRARAAARQLHPLADALRLGPAAPVPRAIG